MVLPLDAKCTGRPGRCGGPGGGLRWSSGAAGSPVSCSNPNLRRNFGAAVGAPGPERRPASAPTPTLSRRFSRGTRLLWVQAESLGAALGMHGQGPACRSQQENPQRATCWAPCCRDGAGVFVLTCLLHQEQGREDPGQHQAPAWGTHPGGWHGGGQVAGREWAPVLAPWGPWGLYSKKPWPRARLLGHAGLRPFPWGSHVCLLSGRGRGRKDAWRRKDLQLWAPDSQDPCPHSPPLPRPSAASENQRERGGSLVPGGWCRQPILGGKAPACGRPGPPWSCLTHSVGRWSAQPHAQPACRSPPRNLAKASAIGQPWALAGGTHPWSLGLLPS